MKSVILLILIIGIIMLTIGYQKELIKKNANENKVIEYRFIPQSLYEEQFGKTNMQRSFKDMFNYNDNYIGHTIT
jgi:hypothetical protein